MGNKIAIVTGATGNLGQAVTKKFINEDFYVTETTNHNNNNNFSS